MRNYDRACLLTASFCFSISTASRQCRDQCIISVQLDEMLNKLRMKINSLFYLYVKGNTVLWCSWWSLSFRRNIWVPAVTPNEWDFVLCIQQEILSCLRLPAFHLPEHRNTVCAEHTPPPSPTQCNSRNVCYEHRGDVWFCCRSW